MSKSWLEAAKERTEKATPGLSRRVLAEVEGL